MSDNRFLKKCKPTVIEKADELGNQKPVREFQVEEKKCAAVDIKESFSKVNRKKRANSFRNPNWPNLEEKLFKWKKNERDEGRTKSTIKIRLKAKFMVKQTGMSDFICNNKWCSVL